MSRARIVRRGAFVLITRTIARREFWLTPDEETLNDLGYLAARAARISGTVVVAMMVEANHHHTILWDPHGLHPRFTEYFHGMVARVWKKRFGIEENLWAGEQVDVVVLLDDDELVRMLVYVFGNPVKDGLVERASEWPGLSTHRTFFGGPASTFRRPRCYFSARSRLPEEMTLDAGLPKHVPALDDLIAAVRHGLTELEERVRAERAARGASVLGVARVLSQDRRACPRTPRKRRTGRGRFAGSAQACRAAYDAERAFERQRRAALELLRAGHSASFPEGTYRCNLPLARQLLVLGDPGPGGAWHRSAPPG